MGKITKSESDIFVIVGAVARSRSGFEPHIWGLQTAQLLELLQEYMIIAFHNGPRKVIQT